MTTDPILAAEQHHLDDARDALHRMRQDTRDWRQVTGGDHVSTQYLRQTLYRRMQSLVDDPSVPLFFGRIDYRRSAGAELDEVCHIGRQHVSAGAGEDPLVVDWRANLAVPFYRARPSENMGVVARRRFGFQHGRLTAYEDESLLTSEDTQDEGAASALLQAEIERPRTGPMRDIVATIQPDQDVLVRADLSTSMAIQGAPGTGKTAVATPTTWPAARTGYSTPTSSNSCSIPGPAGHQVRPTGRRRTWSRWTRSRTSCAVFGVWDTSSSTRPRICRPCNCVLPDGGPRPDR